MDADHVDSLIRSFHDVCCRRHAVAAVLSGALGVLRLIDPGDAEAGGTCMPTCDPCADCKNGTCKKTKSGKK